jgi:hypothetical protein
MRCKTSKLFNYVSFQAMLNIILTVHCPEFYRCTASKTIYSRDDLLMMLAVSVLGIICWPCLRFLAIFGMGLRHRRCFTTIRQWILQWISDTNDKHYMIFSVSAWHIWEAQHAVRNGEVMMHPCHVLEKIKVYVDMILHHTFKTKVRFGDY